jgi:hypothetical protein
VTPTWVPSIRAHAISLACTRLGVESDEFKGVDDLPPEVTEPLEHSLVGALGPERLWPALQTC